MEKIKQPLISLSIPDKDHQRSFSFLISKKSAEKIINVLKEDEEKRSVSYGNNGVWGDKSPTPNLDAHLDALMKQD